MASIAQIHANRENATKSTGPKSQEGKAAISGNALRSGLRSRRLFVEGESAEEFTALCSELHTTLRPQGSVEIALAERIAIALWRQRRLVSAETAALELERRPTEIARAAERLYEPGLGSNISAEDLGPFDEEQAEWCRGILEEVEGLEEIRLETLQDEAPLIYAQLQRDAEEDGEDTAAHVASLERGLTTYIADLVVWCRRELKAAEMRPHLLELAEKLQIKRLVLPMKQLELLARYQTTLDNQLYKALRAFREAQEWRLKTMEYSGAEELKDAIEAS